MAPAEVLERRALVRCWCEYACNGTKGRDEDDPVYRAITEGRDTGPRYSSCGDLVHWLYYRIGVRLPNFVNRTEHHGWRAGVNISRLAYAPFSAKAAADERYECGDVLVVWNRRDTFDAHTLVVLEHTGMRLVSADYGQPGGAIRDRICHGGSLGSRRIQRVLRLSRVLAAAEAAGHLVAAQLPPAMASTPPMPPSV